MGYDNNLWKEVKEYYRDPNDFLPSFKDIEELTGLSPQDLREEMMTYTGAAESGLWDGMIYSEFPGQLYIMDSSEHIYVAISDSAAGQLTSEISATGKSVNKVNGEVKTGWAAVWNALKPMGQEELDALHADDPYIDFDNPEKTGRITDKMYNGDLFFFEDKWNEHLCEHACFAKLGKLYWGGEDFQGQWHRKVYSTPVEYFHDGVHTGYARFRDEQFASMYYGPVLWDGMWHKETAAVFDPKYGVVNTCNFRYKLKDYYPGGPIETEEILNFWMNIVYSRVSGMWDDKAKKDKVIQTTGINRLYGSYSTFTDYVSKELEAHAAKKGLKRYVNTPGGVLDLKVRRLNTENFAYHKQSSMFGVRIMRSGVELVDRNAVLVTHLNEGDWVWFSYGAPMIRGNNLKYHLRVQGYSRGPIMEDEGSADVEILTVGGDLPFYFDSGITNPRSSRKDKGTDWKTAWTAWNFATKPNGGNIYTAVPYPVIYRGLAINNSPDTIPVYNSGIRMVGSKKARLIPGPHVVGHIFPGQAYYVEPEVRERIIQGEYTEGGYYVSYNDELGQLKYGVISHVDVAATNESPTVYRKMYPITWGMSKEYIGVPKLYSPSTLEYKEAYVYTLRRESKIYRDDAGKNHNIDLRAGTQLATLIGAPKPHQENEIGIDFNIFNLKVHYYKLAGSNEWKPLMDMPTEGPQRWVDSWLDLRMRTHYYLEDLGIIMKGTPTTLDTQTTTDTVKPTIAFAAPTHGKRYAEDTIQVKVNALDNRTLRRPARIWITINDNPTPVLSWQLNEQGTEVSKSGSIDFKDRVTYPDGSYILTAHMQDAAGLRSGIVTKINQITIELNRDTQLTRPQCWFNTGESAPIYTKGNVTISATFVSPEPFTEITGAKYSVYLGDPTTETSDRDIRPGVQPIMSGPLDGGVASYRYFYDTEPDPEDPTKNIKKLRLDAEGNPVPDPSTLYYKLIKTMKFSLKHLPAGPQKIFVNCINNEGYLSFTNGVEIFINDVIPATINWMVAPPDQVSEERVLGVYIHDNEPLVDYEYVTEINTDGEEVIKLDADGLPVVTRNADGSVKIATDADTGAQLKSKVDVHFYALNSANKEYDILIPELSQLDIPYATLDIKEKKLWDDRTARAYFRLSSALVAQRRKLRVEVKVTDIEGYSAGYLSKVVLFSDTSEPDVRISAGSQDARRFGSEVSGYGHAAFMGIQPAYRPTNYAVDLMASDPYLGGGKIHVYILPDIEIFTEAEIAAKTPYYTENIPVTQEIKQKAEDGTETTTIENVEEYRFFWRLPSSIASAQNPNPAPISDNVCIGYCVEDKFGNKKYHWRNGCYINTSMKYVPVAQPKVYPHLAEVKTVREGLTIGFGGYTSQTRTLEKAWIEIGGQVVKEIKQKNLSNVNLLDFFTIRGDKYGWDTDVQVTVHVTTSSWKGNQDEYKTVTFRTPARPLPTPVSGFKGSTIYPGPAMPNRIILTWGRTTEDTDWVKLYIYKNGVLKDTITDMNIDRYVDSVVTYGETYEYKIVTENELGGKSTSKIINVQVITEEQEAEIQAQENAQ